MTPQTVEVPLTVTVTVGTTDQPAAKRTAEDLEPGTAGVQVLKTVDERRFTLGLGYPAMRPDVGKAADGFRDFVGHDALEKTAWEWTKSYRNVGLHHADGTDFSGDVVESYIYRGPDWEINSPVDGSPQVIKSGDWLVGVVWSEQAWPLVKQGLVNGWSPQGGARRSTPGPERLAQLRH